MKAYTKYYGVAKLYFSFEAKNDYEYGLMRDRLEDELMGVYGVDEVYELDLIDEEDVSIEEIMADYQYEKKREMDL